jgi:hypothetical protein
MKKMKQRIFVVNFTSIYVSFKNVLFVFIVLFATNIIACKFKWHEKNHILLAESKCKRQNYYEAQNLIISHLRLDSSYSVARKLNAIYLNKNLEALTSNKAFSDSVKFYIVTNYIKYYPYPKYDKIIEFVDLYLADQKTRFDYAWIKKNKPELVDATRESLWHNDSLVLLKALAITENYTVDSFLTMGKFPSLAFYYVIIHGGLFVQQKYFSLFKQLQQHDFIDSYMLATMEDKMLMNENKPQKYGTQLCNPYSTNYYYPYNFFSLDSVNYYRKSIGLPDVIDDWKSFGVNTDSILKLNYTGK